MRQYNLNQHLLFVATFIYCYIYSVAFLVIYFYFICISFCLYVRMCVVSDTIVTDSCKLSRGYWDLNLGPLKEQLVFLTTEHLSGPLVSFFKDLSSVSVQK